MPNLKLSADAHSRVAVLFETTGPDGKNTLMALSVRQLLTYGHPVDPVTKLKMAYSGTHIIQ